MSSVQSFNREVPSNEAQSQTAQGYCLTKIVDCSGVLEQRWIGLLTG